MEKASPRLQEHEKEVAQRFDELKAASEAGFRGG